MNKIGFLKIEAQVIDKPDFSNSVSDFLLLCVAEVSESRQFVIVVVFATFCEAVRKHKVHYITER